MSNSGNNGNGTAMSYLDMDFSSIVPFLNMNSGSNDNNNQVGAINNNNQQPSFPGQGMTIQGGNINSNANAGSSYSNVANNSNQSSNIQTLNTMNPSSNPGNANPNQNHPNLASGAGGNTNVYNAHEFFMNMNLYNEAGSSNANSNNLHQQQNLLLSQHIAQQQHDNFQKQQIKQEHHHQNQKQMQQQQQDMQFVSNQQNQNNINYLKLSMNSPGAVGGGGNKGNNSNEFDGTLAQAQAQAQAQAHHHQDASSSSNQQGDVIFHDSNPNSKQPVKKKSHTQAEQKRRNNINAGFEVLKRVLPVAGYNQPNGKVSKASVLQKAVDYIAYLVREKAIMTKEVSQLRAEIHQLQSQIQHYESRHQGDNLNSQIMERAEAFAKLAQEKQKIPNIKDRENIKFFVFCNVVDRLYDSFNATVSLESSEAFSRSLLKWFDTYCRPETLRTIFLNSLQSFGSNLFTEESTKIFQKWGGALDAYKETVQTHIDAGTGKLSSYKDTVNACKDTVVNGLDNSRVPMAKSLATAMDNVGSMMYLDPTLAASSSSSIGAAGNSNNNINSDNPTAAVSGPSNLLLDNPHQPNNVNMNGMSEFGNMGNPMNGLSLSQANDITNNMFLSFGPTEHSLNPNVVGDSSNPNPNINFGL